MSALDDLMDINANWYLYHMEPYAENGHWEFIGKVDIEQAKAELDQLKTENKLLKVENEQIGELSAKNLSLSAELDELKRRDAAFTKYYQTLAKQRGYK